MRRTDEAPSQTASWSLAMTLAAVGAFLAVIGVFLGWFNVTAVRQTAIFGREVVHSETHAGVEDITGIVVVVVGGLSGLLALGALAWASRGFRRFAASFAAFGGMVALIASGLGITRAATVAQGTGVTLGRMVLEGAPALGVYLSALAGALAAVAGLLCLRTRT